MESLQNYIESSEMVNEGFLMNMATKRTLNNMSPKDLYTGVLNMYDYIVDEDNMELFYQDFPMKERLFWKNLYNLYTKKIWSIFDVDGDSEVLNEVVDTYGKIVKVTPEFRRKLRQLLKESRNDKLDIKPSEPQDVMKVYDTQLKKNYVFTINRTTGWRKLLRPIDAKFLESIFEKFASNSAAPARVSKHESVSTTPNTEREKKRRFFGRK